MFIKLRTIKETEGSEIGNIILNIDQIESIEDYDSLIMKGSTIRMKPVINGFHGDNDIIHKFQVEHEVSENVETIASMINKYIQKKT